MVSISPEPLHTGTHFSPLLPQQAFSPRHHDPVSGTSFQFSLTPAHCETSIASKCLGDCEQIQSIRHTTSVPAYADNEKNCDKTNTGFCVGNHKKVCVFPPLSPSLLCSQILCYQISRRGACGRQQSRNGSLCPGAMATSRGRTTGKSSCGIDFRRHGSTRG